MRFVITAMVLVLSATAFAQTPVSAFKGKYLNYDNESNCPVTIEVSVWPHSAGVIFQVGESNYSVPDRPSFGFPTDRKSDSLFSTTYGPGPEYDGPRCTETADFRFGHLQTTKTCDGAAPQICFFAKSK